MAQPALPTAEADNDLVVDASAERALFVDMLTRDIESIPAIMDLIDNSVDGARALAGDDDNLSDFFVTLDVSPKAFSIDDNCGGIDLDVALKYAFRFGRPEEYKGTRRSVGQFGVGMKRALFKLGDHFEIDSRAQSTSFFLTVPVDEWADDPDPIWTFKMARSSRNYDSESGGRGTTIVVTRLNEFIAEDFADAQFLSLLREQIRYRHQAAIGDGLTIRLNGARLSGFQQELLSGPNFSPINRTFVVSSPEGDVAVRIIAGIVPPELSDIARDETEAENFRSAGDAGWWIFCNDRLLLMRDRSALTGWGSSLPAYHPQYRQFRGFVWMSAAETAALPWNTTKTGVDESSRVWRQVQAQIKISGAQVVSVLNRIKSETQKALSEEDTPTVDAMRASTLVSTKSVKESAAFVAPSPKKITRKTSKASLPIQKFQFDIPRPRFEAVARHMKTDVIAEIGRRIFDYYYDREIEHQDVGS